jgi:tripartite-type tricarboxylate transporter receptor subunit TctC
LDRPVEAATVTAEEAAIAQQRLLAKRKPKQEPARLGGFESSGVEAQGAGSVAASRPLHFVATDVATAALRPPANMHFIIVFIGDLCILRPKRPFLIENRPGAAGNIGTEAVVRAPPDGYTLLMALTPNAINATLYDKLNYNFIRDIAPVASIVRTPNVMVVNPLTPTKSVPEFIAYAKANRGKINMASAGKGSSQHLSGELFKMMAGADMVHVPYRGGAPALTDLIGGQVQVYFSAIASAVEYIRAGSLRALAVTTATRSEALPDIPTVGDFLPAYEASDWYGIGVPKDTPAAVVGKLNTEINTALADPKMKQRSSPAIASSRRGAMSARPDSAANACGKFNSITLRPQKTRTGSSSRRRCASSRPAIAARTSWRSGCAPPGSTFAPNARMAGSSDSLRSTGASRATSTAA